MPKKGNRNKFSDYYCHEDRENNKHQRKVMFKIPAYGRGKGYDRTSFQLRLKNHMDDDVSMAEYNSENTRGRYNKFYKARRGKSTNHSNYTISNKTWFKVIIPYGHNYTKEFILQSLLDLISPHTFVPIMYKVTDKQSEFFLDNIEHANCIQECNLKIVCNNGFKLKVIVKSNYPDITEEDITETLRSKIKLALSKRYIEANNAVDLTCFHLDPELVSDYFCTLFLPIIMNTVLNIIAEHIPNVSAINFNDNKLTDLRALKSLKNQFKNLKILYIGNNRIKVIQQLNILKGLELEELVLQGNPLCNSYKSRKIDYIFDVQKKFPTLKQLDHEEVTQPITFSLEEEYKKGLPSSRAFFLPNEDSKSVVFNFLKEYFQVFDSVNRQNLINAYCEQAIFSLSMSHKLQNNTSPDYMSDNRNLLKVIDSTKRDKLLKIGRIHIMSHIVSMPQTKHIEQSCTVDVCLATKEMIIIVVTGVFKELSTKGEPLRYFNRTLVIVPEGNGFCISNEQLYITIATKMQEKQFGSLGKTETLPTTVSTMSTPQTSVAPTHEIMQQMAITFSQQSNMNVEWSIKCLQECNWNYESALSAFQICLKNGQIPKEAFSK